MYINLNKNIINVLNNSIGKYLPEDCYRKGRIEYNKNIDIKDFIEIEFPQKDDLEIQQDIEEKISKD